MKQGLPPRPFMHYYPPGYPYPMPQQGMPSGPHQAPLGYAFNPALPPRQGHMPGRPPMHLPPQYAGARPPPSGYWGGPEGYPPMDPHRGYPGLEHGPQQGMIRHQSPPTHPGQLIPQHLGYSPTTSMVAHQFPVGGPQARSPGRASPTHAPQNLERIEIPRISPSQNQVGMSSGPMNHEYTGPPVTAAPMSSEQPNPPPGAETGGESPSKLVKTIGGPI